jgi:hypothetical protein
MGRRNGVVPARQRGDGPRCNDCQAAVIWAVTTRGQRLPVDVQINLIGNLVLCFEVDELGRPTSGQLVVAAPDGYRGPLWISHFATCPRAAVYQRRRALRGEL